ncbi:multidrug efflux MFS transporter adaptor subunit VceA [Fundidesulfovibrio butyratiphilus]
MRTKTKEDKQSPEPPVGKKRKRLLVQLALGVCMAGLLWLGWTTFFRADIVSTDNAYTAVELFEITPLIAGPVKSVPIIETQFVHAGDVLVRLDDADMQISLMQTEAGLAAAKQRVRQLFANDETLTGRVNATTSSVKSALADLQRAKADLMKAELDVNRRERLIQAGAISTEELNNTETIRQKASAAVAQATAQIAAAKGVSAESLGARAANKTLIEGTTINTHPDILAAQATLAKARLDIERTVIRSPVAGVVSKRDVEVGQYVQPGMHLMTIVPIQNVYVDANFKETQLNRVRVGQSASVHSDLYGPEVLYTGRVVGFSGGSGSAFAAIPAQEATGNWIKVVQRLPVRIQLDPAQLERHPLRVGMSMHVTVDLSSQPKPIADAAPPIGSAQ